MARNRREKRTTKISETEEVHRFWGTDHPVINGVFEWDELKFNVRSGEPGFSDVGIVRNCIDMDGFSYWHQGSPYTGIVVDLGAHIGGFTCAVARTADHVFAYEASTANYDLLVKNVEINNLKNVTCFHRAVGNGEDKEIVFCGSSTSPSTLYVDGGATETIKGIGLEEILSVAGNDICLLKMDCEGGEYELFMDASEDLIRSFEIMATEIHTHPKYTHQQFITKIESSGFRSKIHPSRADSCKMGDFWKQ